MAHAAASDSADAEKCLGNPSAPISSESSPSPSLGASKFLVVYRRRGKPAEPKTTGGPEPAAPEDDPKMRSECGRQFRKRKSTDLLPRGHGDHPRQVTSEPEWAETAAAEAYTSTLPGAAAAAAAGFSSRRRGCGVDLNLPPPEEMPKPPPCSSGSRVDNNVRRQLLTEHGFV